MDSTWLVLVSLVLGLFIGVGFAVAVFAAARGGERVANVVTPSVPDGVSQLLDALESAGIVVDPSGNVVKASPGALALGLVRDGKLAHAEFIQLAERVRDGGEPVSADIDIT